MKYLLPSLPSFHYFADKGPSSQSSGFSCSHVWMWELDYKESWVPKNWSFWTVVLEKTLESPLDCKEIKPVNPKGNQSWIFIGRTDGEAEIPILWPTNARNWLIGKYHDAGKDWRQEEKGTTEDEMVGRHHWLHEHKSEQALGVGDGQEGLACCSPWVGKELDWTNEVSIRIQMHCVKKIKLSGSFMVFKSKALTLDRCKFLPQTYHLSMCMDLGFWLKWSVSFFMCKIEMFIVSLLILTEVIYIKYLEQWLEHKYLINCRY